MFSNFRRRLMMALQAVKSCFAAGKWLNKEPWTNREGWSNKA